MYIIGEIGSNFSDYEDLTKLISGLKAAGAHAAKFQWISFKKLYGIDPVNPPSGVWPKIAQSYPIIDKRIHQISFKDIQKIHGICENIGIDFMCSVFDPDDVEKLDPLVKHHKLASCEISDRELVWALAKKSQKHVFVSTGAANEDDILFALNAIGKSRITLLYCDSNYPSHRADLTNITQLQNRWNVSVGYSDHTLDVFTIPFVAKWMFGAVALEKHVKLSKGVISADSDHSITIHEFREMVERLQSEQKFMPPKINPNIIRVHKRRAIALQTILPYDRLMLGKNYGYYRMAHDPSRYNQRDPDPAETVYAHCGEIEGKIYKRVCRPGRALCLTKISDG